VKEAWYPLDRRLGWIPGRVGFSGEEKIPVAMGDETLIFS